MHGGVSVQLVDQRQQVLFGHIDIQLMLIRIHIDRDGHLALRTHIDLAGRVLAHQHNRQTRGDAVLLLQLHILIGHLSTDPGCKILIVYDLGCHPSIPSFKTSRAQIDPELFSQFQSRILPAQSTNKPGYANAVRRGRGPAPTRPR